MFNIPKKNKKKIFCILLFISTEIILFFFTKNLKNKSNVSSYLSNDHDTTYTHCSNMTTINIYNTTIEKKYRIQLTAQHIRYSPNQKIFQLIQPNIILFNKKNSIVWKITSNHAILNYKKKIIDLQGYIYIDYKSKNTNFLSILTNQITINLITNNINSNNKVILHGYHFYSVGSKMQGNLYTKTIQLLNNTYTHYEM